MNYHSLKQKVGRQTERFIGSFTKGSNWVFLSNITATVLDRNTTRAAFVRTIKFTISKEKFDKSVHFTLSLS